MLQVGIRKAGALGLSLRRVAVLLMTLGFAFSSVGAAYAAHHTAHFHNAGAIDHPVAHQTHCPSDAAPTDKAPLPKAKATCCVAFCTGDLALVPHHPAFAPSVFMAPVVQPVPALHSAGGNGGPFRPPRRQG